MSTGIKWVCWTDVTNGNVYMEAILYPPQTKDGLAWFYRAALPKKCSKVELERLINEATEGLEEYRAP